MRGQSRGQGRCVEIGSPLEAVRSIGVQAVALARAPHGERIEPCRFDQHVPGFRCDHRLPTAHDASERERLLLVGHDQVFRIEQTLDAIERLQLFALAGAAQDDSAFELVSIESMGGMSHGHGDIVGGVDRVRDELLLKQVKTLPQDAGGGLDANIAERARREASAKLRRLDRQLRAAKHPRVAAEAWHPEEPASANR